MDQPALLTARCWGGPWCGRDLTVAEGRKVFPVTDHGGEYILMLRADRQGNVTHSEWTWSAFCGEQPEDGA